MEEGQVNSLGKNNSDIENNGKERTEVTFPTGKKKADKKVFVITPFLIIVVSLGAFLFFRSKKSTSPEEPTPTPSSFEETSLPTATPTPKVVNKKEFEIEILNGTGISGEAVFLKNKLEELGYSSVKVGNAEDQDNEITEIFFGKNVPSEVSDEVTGKLKGIYKEVVSKIKSLEGMDIQITTGLRVGQSFPSKTPTPKASLSPTLTPTTTPTPVA